MADDYNSLKLQNEDLIQQIKSLKKALGNEGERADKWQKIADERAKAINQCKEILHIAIPS